MLVGQNLSLRPVELSDDLLLQALMNEPLIAEYVVGWSFPVSLHSQDNWIKNSTNNNSTYRFVIVDKQTQEAIGITGLWNIDWHNLSAESAIKILPKKTKKGIGTEALMLVQAWAFYTVGLRRLYAEILAFNGSSLALYVKKCGWRVEGCQKEAIFRKGEWHDLYNVAILKKDFDKLPNAQIFIDFVCPVDTTSNVDIDLSY